MKYENKIHEYINNNGTIGERHEEPKTVKVSNPVTNSGISKDTPIENEPFYELAEKMIQKEEQQKAEPKKKRGRPVGSKTKKPKTRRSKREARVQQTISFPPELHKIVTRESEKNFRPFSNEVQYILTKYYNGEL